MNVTKEDIVIDLFEGSGLANLDELDRNGIHKILSRLGCYNMFGMNGNRRDKLFDRQWAILSSDVRFDKGIYIPYNPWRDWKYNLQWLLDNIPADCNLIEVDVENKWLPLSGKKYAASVTEYLKHIPKKYEVIVYTGEAYLPLLEWKEKGVTISGWPKNYGYGWAQYPYSFYPRGGETWTWEKFMQKLIDVVYSGPYNKAKCPGKIILHQITGDKLVLPGSDKGLDVYVSQVPTAQLGSMFESDGVVDSPPPSDNTIFEPGLYLVIPKYRAGTNGPAISPCNRNTKALGDGACIVDQAAWDPYLLDINEYDGLGKEDARLEWIHDPDGGPSKGVQNGKIKMVGLAYPGNVVLVHEKVQGLKESWARIQCVDLNSPPNPDQINYVKTPWLIHQAFGWNSKNELFPLTGAKGGCVIPVIGEDPWYIPMSELRFPNLIEGMNVRSGPGLNYPIIGSKGKGPVLFTQLSPRETIHDDLWGKTAYGWIAISVRISGRVYKFTDWKI